MTKKHQQFLVQIWQHRATVCDASAKVLKQKTIKAKLHAMANVYRMCAAALASPSLTIAREFGVVNTTADRTGGPTK